MSPPLPPRTVRGKRSFRKHTHHSLRAVRRGRLGPRPAAASRSEDLRLDTVARHLHRASLGHLATCAATNQHPLGLLYRHGPESMPPAYAAPKIRRSRPTTAAAAPTTFRRVHLQVVGREQMTIAADIGYGHGFEDTFQGKAHHISFGCSKARPRYQPNLGLHRRAPDCHVGPPSWQCPGSRYVNGLRTRTPVGAKWSTFRETTTRS